MCTVPIETTEGDPTMPIPCPNSRHSLISSVMQQRLALYMSLAPPPLSICLLQYPLLGWLIEEAESN